MHSTMTYGDARETGRDNGYGIGVDNRYDFGDFDTYMDACTMHESDGFRQFSPFEHYANQFNAETREQSCTRKSGWMTTTYTRVVKQDPDRMWEEYEEGVRLGLQQAWREK